MLRIKGILNVDGLDQPVAVHGVQHVFHPPAILEKWPSVDRRSRLVFIAKDVPEQVIKTITDVYLLPKFATSGRQLALWSI